MTIRTHALDVIIALASMSTGCDVRSQLGQPAQLPVGRYQIVNPTPESLRNTMLLDTVTGKTWIVCTLTDGGKPIDGTEHNGWCLMTQADRRGESW